MSETNDKKTYYFLKVPENFFQDKVMKRLRRLPGGDVYTIIALKILLLGLKDGNYIYFDGIGDNFADEVAIAIDEQSEAVQVTMSYLVQCGWLEQKSETEIYSAKSAEMVGSIKACSLRKRKSRALKCDNVTPLSHPSHADIDIELDIEKEDIDNSLHSLSNLCQNPEDSDVREASFPAGNNKNSSLTGENKTDTEMPGETKTESFPTRIYQDVVDRYNRTCTSFPRCTVISDKRKKLIKACWKEYGEKIYEAFEKAEASDFLSGRSGDWNGCGFDWLMNRHNMLKVLENNYGNCTRKKKNPVDDNMPYRFSNEEFHRQMEEIEKDPRYKGDGDITFLF